MWSFGIIEGCAVLMLDEVRSILARILPKLKNVTNFKVVLLSATLEVDEFVTMNIEGIHQKLAFFAFLSTLHQTGRTLK